MVRINTGETTRFLFRSFPTKYTFFCSEHSLKRTAHTRTYPESKRARTLQAERASPTRQPRYSGTGAPQSETAVSARSPPQLAPAVIQLASLHSASEHGRPVRPALQPSADAEPPSSEIRSPAPSNLCSSDSPAPASGSFENGDKM
jgi:hypothetical protein